MNLSQLEKRLDSVESSRSWWTAADDRDRILAEIESWPAADIDKLIENLFIAEAGARWEQSDHARPYGEILQEMIDEDADKFPLEVWPQQLVEYIERNGAKIPD